MYHVKNRYQIEYDDEELEHPLRKFTETNSDWRISTLSALYDIKYSTTKLKQYASKIKQILSCFLSETKTIKYSVTIERETELRKNEGDPCGLNIRVCTTTGKGPETTSYVAFLMSWGAHEKVPLGTHLPFLLERGRQQIGDSVKMMLTKLFDCCICPVQFTKEQMMLLALNFCQMERMDTKQIKFFYKLPDPCKGKITMAIDIPGLMTIYDSTLHRCGDDAKELVEGVYVGMQRHIFLNGKMDISMMNLCKISHPSASVSASGCISAKSPDILNFMLEYFNETLLKRAEPT